ncbi:GAF domain-containing protein [Arthrobacter oryzae]|uniref:GAF domain-containing protein n=1 Tax=Arthrobacter oryzae TaxID=409290 RepID=A0A3N0CLR7_9MICC|nr:GAF domain-containing protein [Arthrobacter oryzae]RNL63843.1 GAF domain-containing protein [Arthrobacter oryzae]
MQSAGESREQALRSDESGIEEVLRGFASRAEELLQSQERMTGLLEAVVALTEDLSLDAVLERVVQSACTLLQARYGALGVIGDNGALSHFITVGIDAGLAARIGPLPTGHGVLGLLITHPSPLRLHNLTEHPEAYGFPAHHPPMQSFLGVPIRVREVAFGNLYLTQKEGGEDFTAEDEALAVALAAAAGVAIENARLYDDSRRRARWLEACMDVSGLMLSSGRDYTSGGLDPVAHRALRESGSALVLLAAPAEDGSGYVVIGVAGDTGNVFAGETLTLECPVLEDVLDGGGPVVLEDSSVVLAEVDDRIRGPLLAVALRTPEANHGVLLMIRNSERVNYSRTDIEMGAVYGTYIALALELTRVHRLREQLLVYSDRDRIARDLHDLVIQRLFAAGLSVQSLTRFTTDDHAAERIRNITNELDGAIRSLRDTIYSLKSSSSEMELLSGRIRRIAKSSAKALPFVPRLTMTGPVDAVTPDKADNVVAVVSEGLSNAIRHSGADSISVSVSVVRGRVTVVITDNGTGFADPEKRNGLINLEDRARMLNGDCTITSAPNAGTSLKWAVPL